MGKREAEAQVEAAVRETARLEVHTPLREFRVQGSGFRVQGPGSRVQGSRFRV